MKRGRESVRERKMDGASAEAMLESLAEKEEGATDVLVLDPLSLRLKWRRRERTLLEKAVRHCGRGLRHLSLAPSGCAMCIDSDTLQRCLEALDITRQEREKGPPNKRR